MKTEPAGVPPELGRHLAELREKPPILQREEIGAIVTEVLHSLDGDLTEGSLKLYVELEELAKYILNAKQEIAALRPDEITERHLPSATDELDAIVGSTEEATNSILQAMEVLEGISSEMSPEHAGKVTDAVTQVYEACNFQDITGQRITKVVKALKHIEEKVDALVAAFGDEISRHKNAREDQEEKSDDAPKSDRDLLNGPQLPGDATKQDDIDALLASFD
jgi:chemotaxis protein CheZ